jgi:hypothetical protein
MRVMIDECIGLLATSEHSCPKTDKSHLISLARKSHRATRYVGSSPVEFLDLEGQLYS